MSQDFDEQPFEAQHELGVNEKKQPRQIIRDYEFKKPTFKWHNALILQILLRDPEAKTSAGLTDEQVLPKLVNRLREERRKKATQSLPYLLHRKFPLQQAYEERKIPTVDNRLRDLAKDCMIVRIKGFDGLKHNFHPLIFLALPVEKLKQHFPEQDIDEWCKRIKREDVTLEMMRK